MDATIERNFVNLCIKKENQERLIFEDGICTFYDDKLVVSPNGPDLRTKLIYGEYSFLLEEEYLSKIAAEGWVLHTANYIVLGEQECHYFLFVKE